MVKNHAHLSSSVWVASCSALRGTQTTWFVVKMALAGWDDVNWPFNHLTLLWHSRTLNARRDVWASWFLMALQLMSVVASPVPTNPFEAKGGRSRCGNSVEWKRKKTIKRTSTFMTFVNLTGVYYTFRFTLNLRLSAIWQVGTHLMSWSL